MRLAGRIAALERHGTGEASFLVKQWLGWPLTEAERGAAQREAANLGQVDFTTLSNEVREWLLGA